MMFTIFVMQSKLKLGSAYPNFHLTRIWVEMKPNVRSEVFALSSTSSWQMHMCVNIHDAPMMGVCNNNAKVVVVLYI